MKKKFISLLTAFSMTLMLFTGVPISVSAAQSGDGWSIDDNGKLTVTTNAGITAWRNTISDSDKTTVTSVEIGNNVTSIGANAFESCTNLTSVTIPNGVTSIGSYAFYKCSSLTSIEIPNSVTSIGGSAFSFCSSLTSIEIPNSVTSIGGSAFYNCSSLTSIVISDRVTSIDNNTFQNCSSLESVTIPNSVETIADTVFMGCDKLKAIEVNADNTKYLSADGVLFNKDKTTLVAFPAGFSGAYSIPDSVTSIGNYAFYGCSSLESVTIPNSVTSIGSSAFYNCSSLTSIEIPNSVETIGGSAFSRCSSLTSIEIPNSVKTIGGFAFNNCSSLETIFYPDTCTVNSTAFNKTTATEIKYNDNDGKLTITEIILGEGKEPVVIDESKYTYEKNNKELMKKIAHDHTGGTAACTQKAECTLCGEEYGEFKHNEKEIPEVPANCTTAGSTAGVGCSDCGTTLTSPKVIPALGHSLNDGEETKPATCTENGVKTFRCTRENCDYTETAEIEALGHDYADGICTRCGKADPTAISLTVKDGTLTISGTGTIGDISDMVDNKDSIKDVVIEDGITSIGDNAFDGFANLETVTIPDSVTDIGENAFPDTVKTVYCESGAGVEDDDFPTGVTKVEYSVNEDGTVTIENISGVTGDEKVVIPDNIGGMDVAGVDEDVKGKVSGNGHTHRGGTATCTAKAICEICGNEHGELDPNNHTYVNGVCTGCGKADPTAVSLTVKDGTLTISGTGTIGDISDLVNNDKDSIKDVVIEDGITSIGDNAFNGFPKLETVTIPDTVTDIGENAFPDTVKTVYCESGAGVEDNDFPTGVTKVKYSVNEDGTVTIESISGVTGDEKVVIPDNIGGMDVAGVDEKIQDNVTVEGHTHTGGTATCKVKAKCAICGKEYGELDLNSHTYVNGVCTVCGEKDPNAGNDDNISLSVNDTTLTISGTGAVDDLSDWDGDKSIITDVVIEDGITSIGDNTFDDFENLETVYYPTDVEQTSRCIIKIA